MTLIVQSVAESPSLAVDAPPAYGYLRVPDDVPDHQVLRLERALIAFAESEGLSFAGFFFEFEWGLRKGFNDLIAELVRTGAHHVVVPSLRHLALSTRLQDARQDRLAREAGAVVLARLPSVVNPST
ncbi:hypothetical protein [Amycolatopsis vastitatis]|uniref:Resolvase/invertase-type recombinase catalytic domain-containing protein n=1 Tax=Amycolatopsis vastitatis TaxID=1905142 RepID=A0A229SM64_9PSEU|nr:hypothetical protein [Amycolatopsis vastitatis]OXM59874.1 hypothetical protein CF165_45710 [Amycolatopsis vastitatis]